MALPLWSSWNTGVEQRKYFMIFYHTVLKCYMMLLTASFIGTFFSEVALSVKLYSGCRYNKCKAYLYHCECLLQFKMLYFCYIFIFIKFIYYHIQIEAQ